MADVLRIDPNSCVEKTYSACGESITCMVYEGLEYCENPLDEIQKLNVFIPKEYMAGGSIHGYTAETAPIFIPNTVGGYMPGPADYPGKDERREAPNAIFQALKHGYVVASGGVRGRTTGRDSKEFFEGSKVSLHKNTATRAVGKAPAFVVDMKAIVRFLRHNKDILPGDTERVITSGTSAGGALSALMGTTGNVAEYLPYLEQIGAADERDDIYAANCYCPIHNLEHTDMAYEWQFNGIWDFHRTIKRKTENGLVREPFSGEISEEEKNYSNELAVLFPAYVNSLDLRDENGKALTLDENGKGSFLDYILEKLAESVKTELAKCDDVATNCDEIRTQMPEAVQLDDEKIVVDWDAYRKYITRMKSVPAFDALDLKSPENEEFGNEEIFGRHFAKYSYEHSKVQGELAPEHLIRLMNPTLHIKPDMETKYFRLRHGASDRDTSFAIPAILALLLQKAGREVDFAYPWGLPHSGDYDLDEMFAWIDEIV